MTKFKNEIADRRTRMQLERESHKNDLEKNNRLPESESVKTMLYNMAWENGHAYGLQEVEGHYIDLLDLVRLIWAEARITLD